MKRWIALLAVCALVLATTASAATDSSKYRDHVKLAKIVKHLEAFQAIADANGGTRASGTPGYEASADYVAEKLRDKGFRVTIQSFPFAFFQELAPPKLERVSPAPKAYVETTDFFTMTYSGRATSRGTSKRSTRTRRRTPRAPAAARRPTSTASSPAGSP